MAAPLAEQQVWTTLNAFMVGLAFAVEHGTEASVDQVREALTSAARDTCNNSINPSIDCPSGVPTAAIEAAVAQYQAALTAQGNTTVRLVSTGQVATMYTPQAIAAAAGVYYSPSSGMAAPSNVIPPEASPTSPAFTSPANVASVAAASPIAGTASGVGASVGGTGTLQSPLIPAPAAGAVIASLGPNNNMTMLLVLAAVFIIVLLTTRG